MTQHESETTGRGLHGGQLASNIFDTALIFEGGGMRVSYTAAVVNTLLEQGLYFDNVYGLSAGASNTVNYLSRDCDRVKRSFVDLVDMEDFGGMGSLLLHKGMFNARKIYQEACKPGRFLPYDFQTFAANPAKCTISSFERDTGRTVYWTKRELSTLDEVMVRVRASSTLPLLMPPPLVDGKRYYDGGLGEGAGFMLPKAKADGFTRFFIVRTRPKAYRKQDPHGFMAKLTNAMLWRRPRLREALAHRADAYNAQCDEIERLQAEGRAYVFYAEGMSVESGTTDKAALQASYDMGWEQAHRELPAMLAFLEGHIER